MQRTTMLRRAGLAVVAVLSLAVTGCGVDQLAQEGAEQAVEEAVEQGASGDVDIDVDGEGGVKVESSDGSFEVGAQELPDDFPTDAVPLVDGELLTASRISEGEETTWSVAVQTDTAPGDAYDEALAALESAGFEASQNTESSSYSSAIMASDDHELLLGVTQGTTEGGSAVSYTVSNAVTP